MTRPVTCPVDCSVSAPPSAPLDIPRSAYVHIPFCRHRCYYCDFPISVVSPRQRGETSRAMATYVDVLCTEIGATPILGNSRETQPLETVFFGGGTPSLLSVPQLEQILAALESRFGLHPGAEISMEMDPGTFSEAQLTGFLQAGITRISLGVQALEDALLEACGRSHRLADIYRTVAWLHRSAVTSWGLDLISGLPHQHLDQWQATLAQAVDLQPHHISVYDLTIEPQTVFGRRYQPGSQPLPSDGQTAAMYHRAHHTLIQGGYEHYEISNYARPSHRCRHNLTYWQNQPYYGFGLGATSYTNHQRFGRPRTQATYQDWVTAFVAAEGQLSTPPTPPTEQLLDRLMVGLRLAAGIPSADLRSLCNASQWEHLFQQLQPHLAHGRVVFDGINRPDLGPPPALTDPWSLRLSAPEGFLWSNQVIADCFAAFPEALI